jgi:hypothetical protein
MERWGVLEIGVTEPKFFGTEPVDGVVAKGNFKELTRPTSEPMATT